jgi:hypothetical protein
MAAWAVRCRIRSSSPLSDRGRIHSETLPRAARVCRQCPALARQNLLAFPEQWEAVTSACAAREIGVVIEPLLRVPTRAVRIDDDRHTYEHGYALAR